VHNYGEEEVTVLYTCCKCEKVYACNRGGCGNDMARNICVFRISKTIKRIVGGVCWQCDSIEKLRSISSQKQSKKKTLTNNFPYNKHKRKKKRRKRNGRNIQSKNTSVSSMQAN